MKNKFFLAAAILLVITSIGIAGAVHSLILDNLAVEGRIFGRDVQFESEPFEHAGKLYLPLEEAAYTFSEISYTEDGVPVLGRQLSERLLELRAVDIDGWDTLENIVYWAWGDTVIDGKEYGPAYRRLMHEDTEPEAITYGLEGGYTSFYGKLGIEDHSRVEDKPLVFRVYGDGSLLYEKVVEFGQGVTGFDIDVAGVEKMALELSAQDEQETGIFALIDPRLKVDFGTGPTGGFSDNKVVFHGEEVSLGNPMLEREGELYIAIDDLADLFDLPWAYDSDNSIIYLGENPFDEKEGGLVRLDPAETHYYCYWTSFLSHNNWNTHRVNRVTYDNTYRRYVTGAATQYLYLATYRLDREYQWFSVLLGVADDTSANNIEPTLQILGNDLEVLYETNLHYREPTKRVFLDVSDQKFISFRAISKVDHFTNRLAVIDPVLKEKHADDMPEREELHPVLATDELGELEGRYFERSRPFSEPPAVKSGTGNFAAKTFLFSPYVGDWEGKVIHAGEGRYHYYQRADLKDEVKGNIVLVERCGLRFNRQVLYAQLAGAAGVIIYNDSSGIISGPTLQDDTSNFLHRAPGVEDIVAIPVVALSRADGQALAAEAEDKEVYIQVEYGDAAAGNIIDVGKGMSAADYPPEAVGNLVLVQEGNIMERRSQLSTAAQSGAAGIILYPVTSGHVRQTVLERDDYDLPIMGISRQDALDIKGIIDGGGEVFGEFRNALE